MNSSEEAYVDPQRRALGDLMWPASNQHTKES
jgi:hypothetical protein